MTKQEIYFEQQRLQAANDCNFLVMNMSTLLGENLTRDFVAEWADRDDCVLAMPWGIYDGIEGVRRCFTVDFRDIRDKGAEADLLGSLSFDSFDGDIIEVSEDGKTARAVYIIQRGWNNQTNTPNPGYSRKSYWEWGWYGVDFINENGAWKIWHMRMYPVLRVPYGEKWMNYSDYKFELRQPTNDRPAPIDNYVYHPEQLFPDNYPPIPEPYKAFEDVAPGYAV